MILQVTFRNLEPSEPLEKLIQGEVAKLERFYGRIISCRVVVEVPEHHHKFGSIHHVRIDLGVPGGEVVVKEERSLHAAAQDFDEEKATKHLEVDVPHKDVRLAIRDAFRAARRRLQDYARRQRGDVKPHVHALEGRVAQVFPDRDYGFLETPDGREVYFHRNAVLSNAFDRLKAGAEVRFAEERGERGPQASSVRLVRKHRAA
ncbi:MAG TPA: HPF/RaiA family ribosome-associated protein [Bryobacteraceae bacterium]|nr:HPF/RaiA family ribosome-associated protein [Bryobacteraceae bacterium]